MCNLASRDIIKFYQTFGQNDALYSDEELNSLVSTKVRDKIFDEFLEVTFGYEGKMPTHEWIKKMEEPCCNWFYDAEKLRRKLFETA